MKKRNLSNPNKGVRRERDPIPWRYCFLTLICGLLLVGGFFIAARQHFSVMDYAIKNSKLRREKESLESEQRRLYLTREISLSPAEIKKAAKKIGLQELTAKNIEIMTPKKRAEKKNSEKIADAETAAAQPEIAKSGKTATERKVTEKRETKETKTNQPTAGITRPQIARK